MGNDQTRIERAANEAVDPDRLLEGENPSTTLLEDAVHWIRVYEDLLTFKRQMLESVGEVAPEMDEIAQEEVGKTDLTILAAEAARLKRRLRFWRDRADELRDRRDR
jgi:hypothetical protein